MFPFGGVETAHHAFVTSLLDYCNCGDFPASTLRHLQLLHQNAARLLHRCNQSTLIASILCDLHGLPFKFHTYFEIVLIIYRTTAPLFLLLDPTLRSWAMEPSPLLSRNLGINCLLTSVSLGVEDAATRSIHIPRGTLPWRNYLPIIGRIVWSIGQARWVRECNLLEDLRHWLLAANRSADRSCVSARPGA